MNIFGRKSAGRAPARPVLSRGGFASALGEWPSAFEPRLRAAYRENPVAQRAVRLVAQAPRTRAASERSRISRVSRRLRPLPLSTMPASSRAAVTPDGRSSLNSASTARSTRRCAIAIPLGKSLSNIVTAPPHTIQSSGRAPADQPRYRARTSNGDARRSGCADRLIRACAS